ncbi:MAG: SDR family oxidoreductase [Thermoguttaceae bacterium]
MTSDAAKEPTVAELFDLSGKRALVTGASGYLGGAIARALAEAGATVVASSRELPKAQAAADSLPTPGGARHLAVELDHMDEGSLHRGFDEAVRLAGGLEILVNNGHHPLGADWTGVTGEQFSRQLANATGYFLLARRLRDHAVERGTAASVIMLGSMYGVVGSYPEAYEGVCPASPVAYHALKGGIVHLTRHLAVYWACDRVRVNCLSPGPFPHAQAPAEMVKRLCERSPMKRMGLAHELKGAVVLLAGDASSYMTGQNLLIDGGWTAW